MKIESLNIGEPQRYPWRGGTMSSMVKQPRAGRVRIDLQGLVGNAQADLVNHGGEDKAVLCLPEQNYALFGIDQPFGFLGENLTLSGLDETQVAVGDRLRFGEVVLEVTQPRSPCWKLSALTENPHFTRQYAESGRVGFYCRVLQAGELAAGMMGEWEQDTAQPRIPIQPLFLAKYRPETAAQWQLLEQIVQHPALSTAWREAIEQQLQERTA